MLKSHEIFVNGERLLADPSGALFWPARRTLLVADLHLEKGTAQWSKGDLLPPYDSRNTLARLENAASRFATERVVCLGDSFHDLEAAGRLGAQERSSLSRLTARFDWIWIEGNHDPHPPSCWGGRVEGQMFLGNLVLRHQAAPGPARAGEVSGHYHPKATLRLRGKRHSGRAFISDGLRLILPAFGAYSGGLNATDPAISGLFPQGFTAWVIGRDRLAPYPSSALGRGY